MLQYTEFISFQQAIYSLGQPGRKLLDQSKVFVNQNACTRNNFSFHWIFSHQFPVRKTRLTFLRVLSQKTSLPVVSLKRNCSQVGGDSKRRSTEKNLVTKSPD